jgi:hypothetical protein
MRGNNDGRFVPVRVCDGVPMASGGIISKVELNLDLHSNQEEQDNILTGSPKQ